MDPAPSSTTTTSAPGAAQDVRLRLKPSAPVSGYVDGAWWPHSRDLAGELPSLLPALADRLGPIARVAYHLDGWDRTPRRLFGPAGRVALEGFRTTDRNTLTAVDKAGRRLVLLVVPPPTGEAAATEALRTAATADNVDASDTLLAAAR
jgi:hypothetical protein